MAGPVFQWVMARSLTERLHKHYEGQCQYKDPTGIERQYQMCLFAGQQSERLLVGLKGATAS